MTGGAQPLRVRVIRPGRERSRRARHLVVVRPPSSSSYLAVVVALGLGGLACGDGASGGTDGPTIDGATPDGPTIDGPTIDAAIDANPFDAPVDGAIPLAAALDPTFGVGGDVRFPVTSGMGAIATANDGDILACGPSGDLEDVGIGPPAWLGRVDASGTGPIQLWTVVAAGSFETCTGVTELTDGRYAVLTDRQLLVRDAAGGPVTSKVFDPAHRLSRIIAAPDGGLWALGVEGVWRFNRDLVPVASFGVGGLVALDDGRGLALHRPTMATALLTVVGLPRQVRRLDGATGALDGSFAAGGVLDMPQPAGSNSAGLIGVVARAGGAVGAFIDVAGPDGGRGYGIVPVSAAGVAGLPIFSGLPDIGRATSDATDRVLWPSSQGGNFIDGEFTLSRTDAAVAGVTTTTITPPPAAPDCRYRPVGAVTTGGVVIGYTSRCFEPGFGPRFAPRLVRLVP